MSTASLIVAICGLTLSCLSLGWQAANFVLTGGRIRVTLLVGAIGPGGMVTGEPARLGADWFKNIAQQGYNRPIVAVRVANVGRQPVTVQRWGLVAKAGVSLHPVADSIGKPLPHRLEVGQAETWAMDLEPAVHFAETTRSVFGPKQKSEGPAMRSLLAPPSDPTRITAMAELADGRAKHSREEFR